MEDIKKVVKTVWIVKDHRGVDRTFNTHAEAVNFYNNDYMTVTARIKAKMDTVRACIFRASQEIDMLKDSILPKLEKEIKESYEDINKINYKVLNPEHGSIHGFVDFYKEKYTESEWRGLKKSNILMLNLIKKRKIEDLKELREKRNGFQHELNSLKNQLKAVEDLEKLKEEGSV